MTTPLIVPSTQGPEFPADMLTSAQYAAHTGLTPRTLKRALQLGQIPGAVKNRLGQWMIPQDAQRSVETRPRNTPPTAPRTAVEAVTIPPRPVTLGDRLDAATAYLDAEDAATLMGIPVHVIRKDPQAFDALVYGSKGHRKIAVPQATVRRVAGI